MTRSSQRPIAIIAAVIGGIIPFRALLFSSRTDPATEAIDIALCPIYGIARFLPPMGDVGSAVFFIFAVIANGVFYAVVAQFVAGRLSSLGESALRNPRRR